MIQFRIAKKYTLFLSILVIISCTGGRDQLTICILDDLDQIDFALDEIRDAVTSQGLELLVTDRQGADIVISVEAEDENLRSEGFKILQEGTGWKVLGKDAAGAMYGGLELAEQIRVYGWEGVRETLQNPYMELRGTKFNIPLDARTPSYTDVCDAAQKNIPEMWSMDFWTGYIDNLARYRYNYVSLWNLHPFPSMVQVPCYEDVALDDVHRSTVEWEEYYDLDGVGFTDPEILANPEIVKKISMDQKISFWKEVMAYAKSRNIDFYIVTWNIFTGGAHGKSGITDDIDNDITRDYFRKTVKQMFLTYPDLAGIGLTTGENMKNESFEDKEEWAFDTYARGILDAAEAMPDRKFTFIHRQHQTGALDIADKFMPLVNHERIEFLFSFKYAKAHVMSSTRQPYHEEFVKEIAGMKTIWTLRNDDVYQYRWGAPDYVREFMKNIPVDVSRGYYYGSDQWIWGREFLMKEPESPRQLEIVKHWYHWMMWGRLGYNPELDNKRFIAILQNRFPEVDGTALFKAWQSASMIYPVTTGFHWGPLDFQWYIEGCKSRPGYAQNETGFHDVNRFINLPPHVYSGFQSIPDYVTMVLQGKSTELHDPLQVALRLAKLSEDALETLELMDPGSNRELEVTMHDIRTMALLGMYYSLKIEGSTKVALYRATGNKLFQTEAVAILERALEAWKAYTTTSSEQNHNPLWTNRVGYVDWEDIEHWVEQDIVIAQEK